MTRHSALGTRHSALALAIFATLAACGADAKARADSVAAIARRDSITAADARAAAKAREDSAAAAANASTTGAKAGTKTNAKTSTKILGRDSVRQGPIIGLPTIKDTTKRKPPL